MGFLSTMVFGGPIAVLDSWADRPRLSSSVGHLLRRIRRDQDPLQRAASWRRRSRPVAKSERLYPAPSAKGYQPVVRERPWSFHLLSAMAAGTTGTIGTIPFCAIKTCLIVRDRTHRPPLPRVPFPLSRMIFWFVPDGFRIFLLNAITQRAARRHSRILLRTYSQLIRHRPIPSSSRSTPRALPLFPHTILFCSAAKMTGVTMLTHSHPGPSPHRIRRYELLMRQLAKQGRT
ncbi:hypothetical protein BJV78DRAFT_186851 [Lactifluus subvellereus]|nr:hypothetical protein BJV78DRAFT_186851 [Lactifluus subvellereus]